MFCESCEVETVFVLICTLAEQFNVHKSYKRRASTFWCIGNLEENIDLYHIHSAKFLRNMAVFHSRKNNEYQGLTVHNISYSNYFVCLLLMHTRKTSQTLLSLL